MVWCHIPSSYPALEKCHPRNPRFIFARFSSSRESLTNQMLRSWWRSAKKTYFLSVEFVKCSALRFYERFPVKYPSNFELFVLQILNLIGRKLEYRWALETVSFEAPKNKGR